MAIVHINAAPAAEPSKMKRKNIFVRVRDPGLRGFSRVCSKIIKAILPAKLSLTELQGKAY